MTVHLCRATLPLEEASFTGPICSSPAKAHSQTHSKLTGNRYLKCNGIKDELLPDVGNISHMFCAHGNTSLCPHAHLSVYVGVSVRVA